LKSGHLLLILQLATTNLMARERKPKFVEIQLVPTSFVTGAEYNPRKRDPERFNLVKLSLSKLGWVLPMYVTEEGEVLSGHQRLDAAIELGAEKVPVVILKGLDLQRRKGVNIVFNRATNDMHKNDSGESLSGGIPFSIVEEAMTALPDISPTSDEFFPCLDIDVSDTREVMKENIQPFFGHAIRQAESLYHWGKTSIPLVITEGNKVVNGVGRLQHAAEVGLSNVQTIFVDSAKADLAKIMLNKLSMDYDLEDKYADVLRYNSFRRAANVQGFLMPSMCCDMMMAMSKSGTQQRKPSDFDVTDQQHVKAWKRWYGTNVLDFGAGLLDKTALMRDVMGVNCIPFEPYYTGGMVAGFDIDGARAMTDEFLEKIGNGIEFDSIFLASVLNSVPFASDRQKVVTIIAALCSPDTVVYAGAISNQSQRYLAATGAKDNLSNYETQYDSSFAAGYEEGVVVSDLMKRPKAQKYFSVDEWKRLWSEKFSDVDAYLYKPITLVQAVIQKPLEIDRGELMEAIKFEFDLPYPEGRLDRADEAISAFSERLGIKL